MKLLTILILSAFTFSVSAEQKLNYALETGYQEANISGVNVFGSERVSNDITHGFKSENGEILISGPLLINGD